MGKKRKPTNLPEPAQKPGVGDGKPTGPLELRPPVDKEGSEPKKPTGVLPPTRPVFVPRARTRLISEREESQKPDAGDSGGSSATSSDEKTGGSGESSPVREAGAAGTDPQQAAAGAPSVGLKQIPATRELLARWSRMRVRLLPALLAFLVVLVLALWAAATWTASSTRKQVFAEISRQGAEVSADNQKRLDKALMDLRNGDSDKALDQLVALEHEAPEVASLAYLVAVAAMQAGQPEASAHYADKSIARKERVSDALGIKAVLETQSAGGSFGDPKLRAEGYLRQAMVADAANASPLIEIASLLRYRKQNDEAMEMLQAARTRLNPVDSHAVVDTSIALLSLQELADDSLSADVDPDKDTPALFSAAYIAMRKGDFDRAAELLKTARRRLPADLYFYLVNDPALRKYVRQKQLEGLFE